MEASAPPGAPSPNPPPPNPSWNAGESDEESDDECNDLITLVMRKRKNDILLEATRKRKKTGQGDEKERDLTSMEEIREGAAGERPSRLEDEERERKSSDYLELKWCRARRNAVRCLRADRLVRLRECEREMLAEGESRRNRELWSSHMDVSCPLMIAASNGHAELVANLCSMVSFPMYDLTLAAYRARLFGHTAVGNVLAAEIGDGGPIFDDERIVTELTRQRQSMAGASVVVQAELIRAVLNQKADEISRVMDNYCVHNPFGTPEERGLVANHDYLAGVECALLLAVTRGYYEILLRILQRVGTLSDRALDYPLGLHEDDAMLGTLLNFAVMAGNSQIVVTVLQHHGEIESPVMYECLWVALVYHHADVLKTLLDALKQKLTHMLSNGRIGITEGTFLHGLVASPHSLRKMVVDLLNEALFERSRHLVNIVTERFSCQDLALDGYQWRMLFNSVQDSSSIPILRLFILWARGHIHKLYIRRSLVRTCPTMVNMLLAAGAHMEKLPGCGTLPLPEQGPLRLTTTTMRLIHFRLSQSNDHDLVAAIDRLPISPAMKRSMLFRPKYRLALWRASAYEECGSGTESLPVEDVQPEIAKVDDTACTQGAEDEKKAAVLEEPREKSDNENQDSDDDVNDNV